MTFAALFASVWRDFVTDGVPSSGAHNPLKSAIRELGAALGRYLDPKVITANYAAYPGEVLWIDTTAGAVTITAAEEPADPQGTITLIDFKGTWATHNVTFDPGDETIAVPGEADADSLVCSSNYSVIALGYADGKYRVL
jgi:hypothetical protein